MGLYKESNFLRGLKKMSLMQQYGPAKEKESFKREKKKNRSKFTAVSILF